MKDLKTKIFLDSGNPEETTQIQDLIGRIDGQTTNPSLVAKNPEIQKKLEGGNKLEKQELLDRYREIVTDIRNQIGTGSVSIEVYADHQTDLGVILDQAHEMNTWIDNAHIKLPTILNGLKAEQALVREGINVNMTLIFSQEQAAAVHRAAEGASNGQVFVSPFLGRLDDIQLDGMDLVANIQKMYEELSSPVNLLAASIRDLDHLLYCLYLEIDIVTVPFNILKEWGDKNMPVPGIDLDIEQFKDENVYLQNAEKNIADIEYQQIDIDKSLEHFNIQHDLTDKGLKKFADDWNNLIKM